MISPAAARSACRVRRPRLCNCSGQWRLSVWPLRVNSGRSERLVAASAAGFSGSSLGTTWSLARRRPITNRHYHPLLSWGSARNLESVPGSAIARRSRRRRRGSAIARRCLRLRRTSGAFSGKGRVDGDRHLIGRHQPALPAGNPAERPSDLPVGARCCVHRGLQG